MLVVFIFKYSLVKLKSRIQIVRIFVLFLKFPIESPNTTRKSGWKPKGEERWGSGVGTPIMGSKFSFNVSSSFSSNALDT